MLSKRLAALLVAAPAALSFTAPASADPLLRGCWGAASATYCDPTLRVSLGDGSTTPTPVCAGSCVYVGVPDVDLNEGYYAVCIDHTAPPPNDWPRSTCAVDLDMGDTRDLATEVAKFVVCQVRPTTPSCDY